MIRLNRKTAPVFLALVLLVIFAVVVVVSLTQLGKQPREIGTPEPLSADSYRTRVDALLAIARPENGEAILQRYNCVACHRQADVRVAPRYAGLGERAAERRPPLPAAAYVYESIVFPGAFVVEDYIDAMPHDFGARLSDQDLADVIAYLLSPGAH